MTVVHQQTARAADVMQLESNASVEMGDGGAPLLRGAPTKDATFAAVTSVWRRQAFAAARAEVGGGDAAAMLAEENLREEAAADIASLSIPRVVTGAAAEERLSVAVDLTRASERSELSVRSDERK